MLGSGLHGSWSERNSADPLQLLAGFRKGHRAILRALARPGLPALGKLLTP